MKFSCLERNKRLFSDCTYAFFQLEIASLSHLNKTNKIRGKLTLDQEYMDFRPLISNVYRSDNFSKAKDQENKRKLILEIK